MEKKSVLIYGAGGAAKDIIRLVEQTNSYRIEGIIVDGEDVPNSVLGYKILGNHTIISNFSEIGVVIANGTPKNRKKMYSNLLSYSNVYYPTIIHPNVYLHNSTIIGKGSIIEEGVVITSEVEIKDFVYVNVKSTISHECVINDYVTISPQSAIAGDVHIGEESYIGINSTIIEKVKVGKGATIAAGAAVIRDVLDFTLVGGVPAKFIKTTNF